MAFKVTQLYIYPIKSCRGIQVSESELWTEGLRYDRQWMFVDETMNFVTIRQVSEMTRIRPRITRKEQHSTLSIHFDDSEVLLEVPLEPSASHLAGWTEYREVEIWKHKLMANVYNPRLTEKLSQMLGKRVFLAYKNSAHIRKLQGNGAEKFFGRPGRVSFADVLPLLVATEISLLDLNERLRAAQAKRQITIEHFRPNIVVDGAIAWEEDKWQRVSLCSQETEGKLILDIAARCARCQVPNVDPDTGVKHAKEPWTTLVQFRRVDPGIRFKPCYGMLAVPRIAASQDDARHICLGSVKVGDKLLVETYTELHEYRTGF